MEMRECSKEQHMDEGNGGNAGALTSTPNSCTSVLRVYQKQTFVYPENLQKVTEVENDEQLVRIQSLYK